MVTNNQKTEEKKSILQPKNDIVFHALFSRGKERITKALLEDILKIKIDKLELDKSTELSNDNVKDKNGRLDLRAVINGDTDCNIEVQLVSHEKMLERFVYYWAKTYTANLKIGQPYESLRKVISIIIVDDEIKEFEDIKKSHTRWQIREDEYKEKVLTPYFQVDYLIFVKLFFINLLCYFLHDKQVKMIYFLKNYIFFTYFMLKLNYSYFSKNFFLFLHIEYNILRIFVEQTVRFS